MLEIKKTHQGFDLPPFVVGRDSLPRNRLNRHPFPEATMSTNPNPAAPTSGIPSGRTHLSVEEFRAAFGMCRTVAYRLLREKKVKSFRLGKRLFIPVEELVAFPQRMAQQ